MARYRFDYPPEFTTLPEYTAHAGQIVTVLRALRHRGPDAEFEFEGDAMFRIRADDGWEGDAWRSELLREGEPRRWRLA